MYLSLFYSAIPVYAESMTSIEGILIDHSSTGYSEVFKDVVQDLVLILTVTS